MVNKKEFSYIESLILEDGRRIYCGNKFKGSFSKDKISQEVVFNQSDQAIHCHIQVEMPDESHEKVLFLENRIADITKTLQSLIETVNKE